MYQMTCRFTYFRDGPTIGFATEREGRKFLTGDFGERKLFDSVSEAWAWIDIDPDGLPADEVVNGDHADDQYTRRYYKESDGEVQVRDHPLTAFFSSSRITKRVISVNEE